MQIHQFETCSLDFAKNYMLDSIFEFLSDLLVMVIVNVGVTSRSGGSGLTLASPMVGCHSDNHRFTL